MRFALVIMAKGAYKCKECVWAETAAENSFLISDQICCDTRATNCSVTFQCQIWSHSSCQLQIHTSIHQYAESAHTTPHHILASLPTFKQKDWPGCRTPWAGLPQDQWGADMTENWTDLRSADSDTVVQPARNSCNENWTTKSLKNMMTRWLVSLSC